MTDFHKCIQTNSFSDKMYSMSHLWHQMSSPISCPHQPSLSVTLLISPFIQFLFQSPFCSFTTRPAMLLWLFAVVSLSLTPSSLPRSFTPASFPRLTCVFGCNWESTSLLWQVLLEKLELVSFWAFPSQCHLCSSIQLSIMLLLFSPFPFCTLPFCFASPILVLTSLLHSYFVTDVILRSSPFPPFTAGSLLLIITALNIPPTVHLFLTPPPRIKEWNGRFLPSFHHFLTPQALFLVLRGGDATTYSLRLIIPTGSLQHPDQKEGGEFLWLSSSCDVSGNSERLTVGDLCLCAHGVWETEEERQLQWGVVFQAFLAVF